MHSWQLTKNLLSHQAFYDCLVISLLAYFIRAITIGWHGLNDVEAQTLAIARVSDWLQMLKICQLDGNPPIFYLLLRWWTDLFGAADVSVKMLSLLISGLFPPICYLIIAKHLGRATAWQTSVLTIFCPTLVSCSNMVRPYGLIAILTLLAAEQLFNLLAQPQSWWQRIKYSLLIVSLMYSHIFTMTVLLGQAFYIGLGTVKGYLKKNQILAWLIAFALGFIFFLPWLSSVPLLIYQSSKLWKEKINVFTVILYIIYTSVHKLNIVQPLNLNDVIFGIVLYILAFLFPPIIASKMVKQEVAKPEYAWLRQFYWIGLGSLLSLSFILGDIVQAFRDRYISHLIIFFLLLLVVVLNRVTASWPKWLILLFPLFVCLPYWTPQLHIMHSLSDSCAYKAAQPILAGYVKPKDLVVCAWEVYMPEFSRELPNDFRLIAFPDTERPTYINFNGLDKRIADEQSYQKIEKIMLATLNCGGTIWFIEKYSPKDLSLPLQIKPGTDFTYAELVAMKRVKNWLLENAEPLGAPQNYSCYYAIMSETRFRAKAR